MNDAKIRGLIERAIEKLKDEPVRVRLYSLAVIVIGYLVTTGHLTTSDGELVSTIIGTILAVESTRAKVTPARKRRRAKHTA